MRKISLLLLLSILTLSLFSCNEPENTGILANSYQKVEYIESDGNQYIDLKLPISDKTSIEIDFSVSSTELAAGEVEDFNIIGCYGYMKGMALAVYDGQWRIWNSADTITGSVEHSERYTAILNNDSAYSINGTSVETESSSITNPENTDNGTIHVFAAYHILSPYTPECVFKPSSMRLYGLKIYEDGSLVGDYTPCYKLSDNTIGLYDTVTGTFFDNSGTGVFTKGQNSK